MDENKNHHQAINRLSNFSFEEEEEDLSYYLIHFREYCRRIFLWEEELGLENKWPLFDVAAHFNKEHKNYNDLYLLLKNKQMMGFSPVSNRLIQWYIHWESIKERPEIKEINLPHPYEPVIRIFEKGGDIHREHGRFEINSGLLPKLNIEDFRTDIPFVEI